MIKRTLYFGNHSYLSLKNDKSMRRILLLSEWCGML